jgi:hypothetical protein
MMTKAKPKSALYKGTTIPNALLDELMQQLSLPRFRRVSTGWN